MIEHAELDGLLERNITSSTHPTCELLKNGSTIHIWPIVKMKKGKGSVIHRLHVAEAAYFDDTLTREQFTALLECVPPSGEVVIESSIADVDGKKNCKKNLFSEIYQMSQLQNSHILRYLVREPMRLFS
jgi:hypothetical protein